MNELIVNDDIIYLNDDKTLIFPVIHNSTIIAGELRKSILKYRPDIIVVELSPADQEYILKAIKKLPQISVLEENFGKNKNYTIIHPAEPLFEAIRTGIELNSEIIFADFPLEKPPLDTDDSTFQSLISNKINLNLFWKTAIGILQNKNHTIEEDKIREETIGGIFYSSCMNDKKVMLVCGISHIIGIVKNFKKNDISFKNTIFTGERTLKFLHSDSFGEILEPSAFLIQCYEEMRQNNDFDFENSFFKLFKEVEKKYKEEIKEAVKLPNKNLFFKFAYKLSLQNNSLIPSSLDMLLAARSCVDDDFSFHWYNVAANYKWLPPENSGAIRLKPEDFGNRSISFRFRTKINSKKRYVFRPITHSKRKDLDKWKEQWDENKDGLCSYQPEDIFLESYSNKIRKKVLNLAESKYQLTTPFVGSLLDGLDLRETLKNFHTRRLYVKDTPKIGGDVDAVIFIFTEEEEDEEGIFSYQMTWWGENDQESDMSFYSTPPGIDVIGKGISKCEYGGFLLFYPRYSLTDIWNDYDYEGMKKNEVLIMAGIDHSITGNIVLISAKPPTHYVKSWARRSGKKLIFIPIGSLSPSKIRRLKTFHILEGHSTRKIADKYIDNPNNWDNTDL